MQWSSTSSSTRLSYSAVTAACSAWRSTTISAPWHARTDAYSAAVGNTGSAVSDDGDARVGLSDKLDVLVVARLLLQLGAGRAGQLGVDRGRGVGGLLRRDAAREGVRAQYLHVVRSSEERRVGKECGRTCRSRGSPV